MARTQCLQLQSLGIGNTQMLIQGLKLVLQRLRALERRGGVARSALVKHNQVMIEHKGWVIRTCDIARPIIQWRTARPTFKANDRVRIILDIWRLEDSHSQLHCRPIGVTAVLGDRDIATFDHLSIHHAVTRLKWTGGRAKFSVRRHLKRRCLCRWCPDRRLRRHRLTEEHVRETR